MEFPRQEYWSGLPCPPPGDLPDPRIEPASLSSPALAGRLFITSATWGALHFFFLVPNKYLCEIFINHVTSILGLLYVEVMLCPAQEQQAKVTSVIKTKSTFCSQAVCLWSYMKRSYFIPAHTKTLIGLALALIHTPFLSTLFSAIFTLFFPFSVLPFFELMFQFKNSEPDMRRY